MKGSELKNLRKQYQLTQELVANGGNVDRRTIMKIEKDNLEVPVSVENYVLNVIEYKDDVRNDISDDVQENVPESTEYTIVGMPEIAKIEGIAGKDFLLVQDYFDISNNLLCKRLKCTAQELERNLNKGPVNKRYVEVLCDIANIEVSEIEYYISEAKKENEQEGESTLSDNVQHFTNSHAPNVPNVQITGNAGAYEMLWNNEKSERAKLEKKYDDLKTKYDDLKEKHNKLEMKIFVLENAPVVEKKSVGLGDFLPIIENVTAAEDFTIEGLAGLVHGLTGKFVKTNKSKGVQLNTEPEEGLKGIPSV